VLLDEPRDVDVKLGGFVNAASGHRIGLCCVEDAIRTSGQIGPNQFVFTAAPVGDVKSDATNASQSMGPSFNGSRHHHPRRPFSIRSEATRTNLFFLGRESGIVPGYISFEKYIEEIISSRALHDVGLPPSYAPSLPISLPFKFRFLSKTRSKAARNL